MSDETTRDDGPGTASERVLGADPYKVIHQHAAALIDPRLLTTSRHNGAMGSGDARPPKLRPGSTDAAALPSRVGNRLYWPDGRRTSY